MNINQKKSKRQVRTFRAGLYRKLHILKRHKTTPNESIICCFGQQSAGFLSESAYCVPKQQRIDSLYVVLCCLNHVISCVNPPLAVYCHRTVLEIKYMLLSSTITMAYEMQSSPLSEIFSFPCFQQFPL